VGRKLTDLDVMEIRKFFEDGLSRAISLDKRMKMRLRRKIRDEVFNLLTWEKPNPVGIMNRWEDRMLDAFNAMPYGFKEDLFKLLAKKMDVS
jgi:hypothetical protein